MIVYENKDNLIFSIPKDKSSEAMEIKKASTLIDFGKFNERFFRYISEKRFCGLDADKEARDFYRDNVKYDVLFDQGYNFESQMAYSKSGKNCSYSVSSYKISYPKITQFFVKGMEVHRKSTSKLIDNEFMFNLGLLIPELDKNIDELIYMLDGPNKELVKRMLYKYYVDFAIFYYEIYPFIEFQECERYNIEELRKLKEQTEKLRMSTQNIDDMLNFVPVAQENSKVITLLKRGRNIG